MWAWLVCKLSTIMTQMGTAGLSSWSDAALRMSWAGGYLLESGRCRQRSEEGLSSDRLLGGPYLKMRAEMQGLVFSCHASGIEGWSLARGQGLGSRVIVEVALYVLVKSRLQRVEDKQCAQVFSPSNLIYST